MTRKKVGGSNMVVESLKNAINYMLEHSKTNKKLNHSLNWKTIISKSSIIYYIHHEHVV